MLFNEPKLLKSPRSSTTKYSSAEGFSALQRAEIAEILLGDEFVSGEFIGFSALQRAEIAEMWAHLVENPKLKSFSALQRAEIAEMRLQSLALEGYVAGFSALQRAEIAEMYICHLTVRASSSRFSALQRAEIAEIRGDVDVHSNRLLFQCSSTSRNC